MAGFIITTRGKQENDNLFLQTAAVYTALLSVFAAFYSVFDTDISLITVSMILLVVVPALELLLRTRKRLVWKILSPVILLGIAAVLFRETLMKGITPFVNSYIDQRNTFYAISQPGIDLIPDAWEPVIVLAGILTLLGWCLAVVLKLRRGFLLALAVLLIPVILAATVGHMPSTLTSWYLIASAILYLTAYRRTDGAFPLREIAAAFTVLVFLFACTLVTRPLFQMYKESHQQEYENIKTALSQSQEQQFHFREMLENQSVTIENYASGGVGEGSLENLHEFRPQGTTEMEVTVSDLPQTRIYLKAYVGTTYTGKAWEELDSSRFSSVISPILGDSKRRELMNEPFTRIANGTAGLEPQQMQITLAGASSSYGYSPYYAEIPETDNVKLDAYVEGSNNKNRTYTYYSSQPVETLNADQLAEPSDLWISYQEFVQDTYTEYPEDLEQLASLCEDLSLTTSDIDQLSDAIDDHFSAFLRYTPSPASIPSGQDFAEYFLFESRNGFCVHFASAATLIYRECGYPARYVEGYAISPDAFTRQEDGTYKAVVTDNMAHAWCETFNPETGWQVREHTLPYQDDSYVSAAGTKSSDEDSASDTQNTDENPLQDNDITPEDENIPPTETEDTDGETAPGNESPSEETENFPTENITDKEDLGNIGDNNANGSGNTDGMITNETAVIIRRIAGATGILFLLLCLAVFACVIQQRIRRQKKLLRFRIKKENKGIASIYNEIYEICLFLGMEQTKQTDREAFEQMKQTFPQLTTDEWTRLYDCAVRGAFTAETIGRDEQKQCYQLYQKFRKKILAELKGKKRVWFLYGKGL